jgi:hypothetical protein
VGVERTITEVGVGGQLITHVSGVMPAGYDLITKATYDSEKAASLTEASPSLAQLAAMDAAAVAVLAEQVYTDLIAAGVPESTAVLLSGHQV